MEHKKGNLITRREAILSLATISAGAFIIKPSSVFCSPVKDKIRFAIVGDWGTGERDAFGTAAQMFAAHRRSRVDFVISAGDNIYPNGSGRYFAKNFEQPFASLLKDPLNFYTVLGNHDVEAGRQDQCQYPLFHMGGQNYYKLEKGDGLAEFFMLDSTDFDSAQAMWLEGSLRASKAKWKIAVFHHPIYSSGKKHGSALGLRKLLEPLLTRYGVKVAFSGHDHIYERTKPQQGVQYFVTGAGGKTRRGDVDLGSSIRETSFDEDNHFMLIEVEDKQVSFEAITETGSVIDSGSIKQA
ncbi:MAG TPA: metallophosphoesterase [Blastocatellia bacterium]|nr:metallophosphoesterase [Blastocatellia bacterium]